MDALNDKSIKAALKSAKTFGKGKRISDGAGLYLESRPTGAGWWRFRYFFGGKEKMLSLGVYPDVGLAEARQRRDDARKQVAAGVDPSKVKQSQKEVEAEEAHAAQLAAEGKPLHGTFEYVAREWLTTVHEAKVSEGHAARTRIRFEQDVFPHLGSTPMDQVEPPALLSVLRQVINRGAIETAHRIKDACGQVFRYGIACGICARNPAADLRDALPPVPTKHHAAIVDPEGVAGLLKAMVTYEGHPITKAAMALSVLFFLRPGELRQLEWAWVDFDQAKIEVPSTLMKRRKDEKANGAPHFVPLASQAIAILKGLQSITGHERYLFPSMLSNQRPMSENTVRSALRRMGYDNDTMTAHGFRAMARTILAERLGVDPQVIEAQLAHAVPDALGMAYNRTTFLEQRKSMMKTWADYLDQLREGAQIIPIKAA